MNDKDSFEKPVLNLSLIGLSMMMIGAPTSSSMFGLGSLLLVLCLFSPKVWKFLKLHWLHLMTAEFVALFIIQLTTLIWTIAPLADAIDTLSRYSKLLLIPLVATAVAITPRLRGLFWSLLAGHGVLLGLLYLNYFFNIPGVMSPGGALFLDHSIFTDYIAETISLVFLFIVVTATGRTGHLGTDLSFEGTSLIRRHFAAAVVTAFAIICLTTGRGGQVILGVVAALAAFQLLGAQISKKSALIGVVLGLAVFFLLLSANANFQRGISDLLGYRGFDDSNTSWGIRVGLLDVGWKAAIKEPWLGYGVGSWHTIADTYYKNASILETARVFPNNQLVHFSVELGVLGAVWFFWFLFRFWQISIHRQRIESLKMLATGVFVLYVLDSVFHAAWFRSGERETFILAFGLVLGLVLRAFLARSVENRDEQR